MSICCLALADYAGDWFDQLDARLSHLGVPAFGLVDLDSQRSCSSSHVSVKKIFNLRELAQLKLCLANFEYVLVVSENYLPVLDIKSLPLLAALNTIPDSIGLTLRPLSFLLESTGGKAAHIIQAEKNYFVSIDFRELGLHSYPRFDCCCCLYKTKLFLELTLDKQNQLSSYKEIEAFGAKAIRQMTSFSYIGLDRPFCEIAKNLVSSAPVNIQQNSNSKPEISVVIPTKDRGSKLVDAVNSVLNQSFSDFELLLVNDGVQEVDEQVSNSDGRIRQVPGKRLTGVSAARNRGIRAAKGKYIAYLDDDDMFWTRHLELLHASIEDSASDFIFSNAARTWEKNGEVQKRDFLYPEKYSLEEIMHRNFITTLSVLHKREALEQVGYFDENMSRVEDWDLWLRFALNKKIHQIDNCTGEFIFPMDGNSTTTVGVEPFIWHEFIVRAKNRERYKQLGIGEQRLSDIMQQDIYRFLSGFRESLSRDSFNPTKLLRPVNPGKIWDQIELLKNKFPEYENSWSVVESTIGYGIISQRGIEEYRHQVIASEHSHKVSIVIPLYNCVELTRSTIKSLYEHTDSSMFELILVDNASFDATPDLLKELEGRPGVKIIRNAENRNFSGACNQGALIAEFENILFLNSDVLLSHGWLDAMLEVIKDPSVGVVGNKQLFGYTGKIHHCGVFIDQEFHVHHHLVGVEADDIRTNYKQDFQIVTGSCFLIRKKLFELLTGFDEGFINGMEDCDLCLKVKQLGFRVVYTPHSQIYHFVSQSPGRKRFDKQNAERFLKRWSGFCKADLKDVLVYDQKKIAKQISKSSSKRIGFVLDEPLASLLAPVLDPLWSRLHRNTTLNDNIDKFYPILSNTCVDSRKFDNLWWFRWSLDDKDESNYVESMTTELKIDSIVKITSSIDSFKKDNETRPSQLNMLLSNILPEGINPFLSLYLDPPKMEISNPDIVESLLITNSVDDISTPNKQSIYSQGKQNRCFIFALRNSSARMVDTMVEQIDNCGPLSIKLLALNLHYSAIYELLAGINKIYIMESVDLAWRRIFVSLGKALSLPIFLVQPAGLLALEGVLPSEEQHDQWAHSFIHDIGNRFS